MASSYLDLYTGAGGFYNRGFFGGWTPAPPRTYGWGGGQQGTYRGGETQRVVHDTANNIYYGQQKQSDLVKGLQDSIARTQAQLTKSYETRYRDGWGGQQAYTYRYSAADRAQQKQQIANQQNYLKHINNGGYKQEGNKFYESYDAWTGDWNNLFNRRKSNSDTLRRNDKISEENDVRDNKAKQQDTKVATWSVAKSKKLTPNLEINTGISAAADKLVQSLNKTGLGI